MSQNPSSPNNETERLQALRSYDVLDTLHEEIYHDLVKVASTVCGTPVALITLIDDKKLWFKAQYGINLKEVPRETSFCSHTLSLDSIIEVHNASLDKRFQNNPLVTGEHNINFYAGAPLKSSDGHNIGTICVLDTEPRELTDLQKETLMILAHQVQVNLELRKKISKIKDYELQVISQFERLKVLEKDRKELTALVVHDLKSPLNVIQLSSNILTKSPDSAEKTKKFAETIKASSDKMLRLVMNVLDVSNDENGTLKPVPGLFDFKSFIDDLVIQCEPRVKQQGQEIIVESKSIELITDENLLRRILENLIDNSLKYSSGKGKSISIDIHEPNEQLIQIKIIDEGTGIKPEDRERVFQKYTRLHHDNEDSNHETSRGLGLVFCRLAAKALGGKIYIEDGKNNIGSTFCLEIPRSIIHGENLAA